MSEITRRDFLALAGGSGAAAALEPGRQMVNKLIPWVVAPEKVRPGEWSWFATTCRECPAGCGMLLWHRDGRVTKAEGNPEHPVNRGGLCPRGQSALQGLYDPDRLRHVYHRPRGGALLPSSWHEALETLAPRLAAGGRVAIVSDLQTGAQAEVMAAFATAFAGRDRLLFFEPFSYEPLRAAHRQLFGRAEIPAYRLEECDFLISFAADFLETWISPVGFASQFARMHTFRAGRIGKFAYVGPRLSMTAGSADEFIQVPPGNERWVALAMLQEMLDRGMAKGPVAQLREIADALSGREAASRSGVPAERLRHLAEEFAGARASVALAGAMAAHGPAAADACVAAALLNVAAGRHGTTVDFSRPHALGTSATDEKLRRLTESLAPADTLIIHRTNLAFTRPPLVDRLRRAGAIVYLSELPDETAEIADWVLPLDHPLEWWGDYQPYAGAYSLLQPTMGRLGDSRNTADFLITLADAAGRPLSHRTGGAPADFYDWLRQSWQALHHQSGEGENFETFWMRSLQRGGYWREEGGEDAVELRPAADLRFAAPVAPPAEADRAALWLWPSPYLFDGRLANRAWLQEMPDPISTIVWGSWLDIHPKKGAALGVRDGEEVEVATSAGTVRVPVRFTFEIAEGTVALPFGQGHRAGALSAAQGIGVNAFVLLDTAPTPGPFAEVELRRAGGGEKMVCLSASREQHGREIVQTVTLSALQKMSPGEGNDITLPLSEGFSPGRDLYSPHAHREHRWAMAIDLQKCIGCHACAVACYAENNIPVLGRQLLSEGREMTWLQIPPYVLRDNPHRLAWLPLPCQHCDQAPCEPVCPVFAAVHNEEGLNAQIYNRCIGTRYCSNNCPYKVRRFNWVNIRWKEPLHLQLNPEVTVRSRGVMEKCTFCVQRIRQAEYHARIEDRPIRDGEIQPACVQSCPTRVFTFGDLMDERSEVSRIFREDPRRYQLLHELNTKPAVVYLRKIVIDT